MHCWLLAITLSIESALQNFCNIISSVSFVDTAVNNATSFNSGILGSPGGLVILGPSFVLISMQYLSIIT